MYIKIGFLFILMTEGYTSLKVRFCQDYNLLKLIVNSNII